jgi:Arc/MetJ-type ribon-helix-helix transcriptional regulator
MAMSGNVTVPEELLAEVQKAAQAEQRSPDEVVKLALERYLEERSWQKTIEGARQRSKDLGLTEADVPRLIAESRRETAERER